MVSALKEKGIRFKEESEKKIKEVLWLNIKNFKLLLNPFD